MTDLERADQLLRTRYSALIPDTGSAYHRRQLAQLRQLEDIAGSAETDLDTRYAAFKAMAPIFDQLVAEEQAHR